MGADHAKPGVQTVGLGEDLAAAHETIEVLVRRYEGLQGPLQVDQVAIRRALATLEGSLDASARALQASEARLRTLFDHGPHMLVTVDAEGLIRCANQAAACALGCPATELVEQALEAFLDEASARRLGAMILRRFEGVVERVVTLRSGIEVALTAAPLPGFVGETQIVMRDLTWRRLLEEELQNSRRLAFLGNLASVVGHEINNPLAVMLGRLELLLQSDLDDPEGIRRQLARVLEHGHRVGRIVSDLQAVARPQKADRAPLDLHALVRGATAAAAPFVGRTVIHAEVSSAALPLEADHEQLTQALVTLLSHASDRMRRTGRILLSVAPGPGRGLLAHQGSVSIRVVDAGPAIRSDLMERLLTPAQQGSRPRSNHALGLAIVRNIVLEHGGIPWAGNLPSGEAEVGLLLPLPERETLQAGPLQGAEGPRVLCVDDDPLMVHTLELMLTGTGCRWQVLRTGEDALRVLRNEDFDALLVGLQLPGMSGVELRHTIATWNPRICARTIFIGSTLRSDPDGVPTLPRPFSRLQLLYGLERVVAEEG
ncbi:MAG: response regulator [Pseudomonadota bacterium]